MAKVRSFRELLVWQKAMDLADLVYTCTAIFPREELYGLTAQLRRSAVSIPPNIAEGQGRNSKGEFLHFLGIAQGSLCELETQVEIAKRRNWIAETYDTQLASQIDEISRMLSGLMRSLRASSDPATP